ncbi:MAG: hypothetical protein DME25_04315 [Verrucomicrobia bacterium]|nr:MAG: hypothetical protein DME25_04315 [Verrucomicrobiota bacterium]
MNKRLRCRLKANPASLFIAARSATWDCQMSNPSLFIRGKMKVKIAQFGLGPIGLETLKLAATKSWAEIVGGIDIDPAKIGRDLGELTQTRSLRGCGPFRSSRTRLLKSSQ